MLNIRGDAISKGSEILGKVIRRGEEKGKRFKVEHKGSSKLGITALGQAGQMQCDNGPKNIPV